MFMISSVVTKCRTLESKRQIPGLHLPADCIPTHLKSHLPGVSTFSTWAVVSTVIVSCLVSIFMARELMKDRHSFKLQTLFRFHNALLSAGSFILLLLIAEEVVSVWIEVGTYDSVYAPSSWNDRLELYYMVNYYFKYYEFPDTLFLVLKKKSHPSRTAVSINLLVHVVMYCYYYATAGGAKFWWKKYLTAMQIIQFIIDLFVFYFGLYQHYVHKYFPALPHLGDLDGDNPEILEKKTSYGPIVTSRCSFLMLRVKPQTFLTSTKNKS
ncbi:GNS1/SUR4 membrane protein [Suillus paluster]|uniref:GNS1/SUR4 membrane protein n=1 Tax=Suillus paluster TaxID=48578 RepID=UPI001B867F50|nr:GNS1/SUR4 membrane protein [Suillus paluster]KAG1744556.1 GNS1/SUR4 membrane protein [Suillus paluster]